MKRFIIIVIVLVVLIAGFAAFSSSRQAQAQAEAVANLQTETIGRGSLMATIGATGVVRSNQSAQLAWDTSGTAGETQVQVGDAVTAEQLLSSISQTSLPQSIILAEADKIAAEEDLEDLMNADLQQAQALQAIDDAAQAIEDLGNTELQLAQALQAITLAEDGVEDAERSVLYLQATASQADIDAAKAQVLLAEQALDRAQDQFDPFVDKPEDNLTRANLLANLSAKQAEYDAAVRHVNALQSTGNTVDIARADADLVTAQAELLDAQQTYQDLLDGPSGAQVALAEAQLVDAQRAYDHIKDGPHPNDIAAIESRIAAAEAALTQAHIKAPFDGTITVVNMKPGDQVAPGAVAFRLDDLSRLLVDVEVSEVDINRIQLGQAVVMSFDAVLAKEYNGVVTEVGLVGNDVQGVVSFNIVVEILDADDDVRPGMTAGISIIVSELENVLLVPNRAVRVRDGERVIYMFNELNFPEAVPVELGSSSDTHSEIVGGGLNEGDEIILNPPSDFSFFGGGPPGGQDGGGP